MFPNVEFRHLHAVIVLGEELNFTRAAHRLHITQSTLSKATVAKHRIWAGPESLLSDAGGTWSEGWINGKLERSKGGFQEERDWERDPLCDVCGGSDIVNPLSSQSDNPNNALSSTPPS